MILQQTVGNIYNYKVCQICVVMMPGAFSVGDDEKKWTAHAVELSLWSYVVAKRLRPSLLQEGINTGPGIAGGQDISRPCVSQDSTSDDDSLPRAKRPKL